MPSSLRVKTVATKELKRMNRFELLELMYELVRENEKLRRKCERLEGRGGADEWDDTAYSRSAREKARAEPEREYRSADEDEHYRTRREEVMQRMMEQTYQPAPSYTRQKAAPAKRAQETERPLQPIRPAAQPVSRQQARQPARPQPEDYPVMEQTGRASPRAQPVRQAAPAQQPKTPPPARQAAPKPQASPSYTEDFDIDSILSEYLVDQPYGRGGGSA